MSRLREQRKLIDAQLGLLPEKETRTNEIAFQIVKRPNVVEPINAVQTQQIEQRLKLMQQRLGKKLPDRARNNTQESQPELTLVNPQPPVFAKHRQPINRIQSRSKP